MRTEPVNNRDLDRLILEAHARFDSFGLASLYHQAAQLKLGNNEGDASGFLLTQAYVYALESGHPDADVIRNKLVADGRETTKD